MLHIQLLVDPLALLRVNYADMNPYVKGAGWFLWKGTLYRMAYYGPPQNGCWAAHIHCHQHSQYRLLILTDVSVLWSSKAGSSGALTAFQF